MQPFDGLSVLLLEDEYLIAMDAEQTLTSFGVGNVNIVNSLDAAEKAADGGGVDVAILDININGRTSFEVAERFRSRGTPVVFASGYGSRKRLVPDVEDAIYLNKPYTREALKEAVLAALKKGRRDEAA
jgi:DNA-binding NtrC family response regulator